MKCYIKNVYKSFNELKVLDNISLEFEENKVTCILGPSGCGKTTLVNILASIARQDSGIVEGFNVNPISVIFQEDRLIEWRTVEENVDFVLKSILDKSERNKRIEKYLRMVGLYEYKKYYPSKLSGGMRQRANIARAFAYSSEVLIMDEPFKSLDINTKQALIKDFYEFKIEHSKTVIFVTHDIEEAVLLGDKIVILTDKPAKVKMIIENNISYEKRWGKSELTDGLKEQITTELFLETKISRER